MVALINTSVSSLLVMLIFYFIVSVDLVILYERVKRGEWTAIKPQKKHEE